MSAKDQLDQRLSFMRFDHRSRSALQGGQAGAGRGGARALDSFYEQGCEASPRRGSFSRTAQGEARRRVRWRTGGGWTSGDQAPDYVAAVERIGQSNARAAWNRAGRSAATPWCWTS
jgi:methyl-accepting chemotaxis protein